MQSLQLVRMRINRQSIRAGLDEDRKQVVGLDGDRNIF
jgi:hypothetical protein